MAQAVSRQRLNLWLFSFFGVTALVLAAIGVGGVIGFSVSSRTREIGIRVAVGASGREVRRMVIADAVRLSAVGVMLGLGAALVLGRWLSGLLYETTPSDAATLIGVAIFLLVVTVVASWLPARRASQVDPIAALRAE